MNVFFIELSGRKVIVLEKAKKPSGCTYFAHGFMVKNSKWHKEAGMPGTRDDSFRGDGAGGWVIDSFFLPTGPLTWAVCSGYMAGTAAGEYLRRA